ncbi:MAG: hypothetical protein IJO49_05175 [Clostridia bacterium]|nr:hypothetical protein [Clostridia bacterium]
MFNFPFKPLTLDEAFQLLIDNRIIAKEFKQASRIINRLSEDDWRLWFGRFLLHIRSNPTNENFSDAFICLEITLETLKMQNNPMAYREFVSYINTPALFLAYKFYYEATGSIPTALLLALAFKNGWGVIPDEEKAFEFAAYAASNKYDPLYQSAQELLNAFTYERLNKSQPNPNPQFTQNQGQMFNLDANTNLNFILD